jgi:two-component system, chemotaxis family, protein-glutamate methylesterase/glutaminase
VSAIRVLIVDDSAFARKVVRESLLTNPQIEVVGIARDGIDALEKIVALKPDVITLDLVMPNLDGLGVLAALTAAQRSRVVVVSMADGESDIGISALAYGVFDLVHKPTALAVASLHGMAEELVSKVLLAAAQPRVLAKDRESAVEIPSAATLQRHSDRVVLIGTSTGGPQALTRLLKAFPANFPAPIAIVLHIPEGYTGPLAERLNGECAIEVLEAKEGLSLRPGRAILAKAGMHLSLAGTGDELTAHLDLEPRNSVHRPSVDVLFRSAASCLGRRALAVVLTGMGSDGLDGARALTKAGGQVMTESEASCVVYGMPRVVREAGLSIVEAPLEQMATEIDNRI